MEEEKEVKTSNGEKIQKYIGKLKNSMAAREDEIETELLAYEG